MKRWKILAEGVGIAMLVYLATALVDFDAAQIKDWHTWVVGLLSGMVRAIAPTVLAMVNEWRQR